VFYVTNDAGLVASSFVTMSMPDPKGTLMNAIRVEKTVEADGELHLTNLPCRRGDKVEAIVLLLEQSSLPAPDTYREQERATALLQYLALAHSSSFRSAGPYPSRDELHERP
jgi:hypothetical protein